MNEIKKCGKVGVADSLCLGLAPISYSSLQIRSLKVDDESKKVSIYTDSPWLRDDDRGYGMGMGIGSGGSGIGIRFGR